VDAGSGEHGIILAFLAALGMRITCGNGFCDLAKGDSDTEAANRLLSASYAALGRRWIGRRLGWRTALERVLERVLEPLEVRCQATLHEWLARAAVSRLGSRPVGARRPRLSRTPRGCAGAGRGPRSS
jgi:hypothetical protein